MFVITVVVGWGNSRPPSAFYTRHNRSHFDKSLLCQFTCGARVVDRIDYLKS